MPVPVFGISFAMEVAIEAIGDGPVTLIVEADEHEYSLSYALDDQPERRLATGSTRYVSTEVCGGFTGVYLGMYATGNGRACTVPADFGRLEYTV